MLPWPGEATDRARVHIVGLLRGKVLGVGEGEGQEEKDKECKFWYQVPSQDCFVLASMSRNKGVR